MLYHNQIPIGMKTYSGNESESLLYEILSPLLKRRTTFQVEPIHVADKSINCAQNIAFARMNKDGYLFSKSVKGLSKTEKHGCQAMRVPNVANKEKQINT